MNRRFADILEERWRAKLHRRNLQVSSIPDEILLHIFRSTQPQHHGCDPSIVPGPRSRWLEGLRMKKSLVLVCRGWACPATELLYADIVLRRMGQITALAHTLRTQNYRSPLSMLVKTLRMDCCVVFESCADVVRSDLEFLLRECTNLLSFSFHSHPLFPFSPVQVMGAPFQVNDTQHFDGFNPSWILEPKSGAGELLAERLACRLSTLDIAVRLADRHVFQVALMLVHATNLTSLSLGRITSLLPGASHPTIHLPALTTLQVYLHYEPFADYIATQWQMPRLTALTCLTSSAVPVSLLATHAAKLTYLHFYDDSWAARLDDPTTSGKKMVLDAPTLLPHLYELCPAIEHLVLYLEQPQLPQLSVVSPTLRYLDITQRQYPNVQIYKTIALAPDADAPSLESIRFVQDLGSSSWIPRVCHPSLRLPADTASHKGPLADLSHVPDNDDFLPHRPPECIDSGGIPHVFPKAYMRQQAWAVSDEPVPEFEDNSDDEYFPPGWEDHRDEHENEPQPWNGGWACRWGRVVSSASSEADSDGSLRVDEGGEISSEDRVEGPQSYDRETVLQMFRAGSEGDILLDEDFKKES
ncbi:hypothetical protein K466DRAFT_655033 [Polyporus arcularius HHB13444]|uniref:Uncharacterized protein n=1 Tax=Polyporus arcularius HHB13444 TaxID=1314778 RepID=A0A5C3P2X4_9APHY|nr:hypothetical protein K466DRAFT_655033 [Polyporus arcularius HHB13444]